MTATISEIEVISLEDHEFSSTCMMCEHREAEWGFIHLQCCDRVDFLCTGCKVEMQEWLSRYQPDYDTLVCKPSNTMGLTPEDFQFERL